jgi:hypothetical protein
LGRKQRDVEGAQIERVEAKNEEDKREMSRVSHVPAVAEDEAEIDDRVLEIESVELIVEVTEVTVIVEFVVTAELNVLDEVPIADELEDDAELELELNVDNVLKRDKVLDAVLVPDEAVRLLDPEEERVVAEEDVAVLEVSNELRPLLDIELDREEVVAVLLKLGVLELCPLEKLGVDRVDADDDIAVFDNADVVDETRADDVLEGLDTAVVVTVPDKTDDEEEDDEIKPLVLEEENTVPAGTEVLELMPVKAPVLVEGEEVSTVVDVTTALMLLELVPAGEALEVAGLEEAAVDVPAGGLEELAGVEVS